MAIDRKQGSRPKRKRLLAGAAKSSRSGVPLLLLFIFHFPVQLLKKTGSFSVLARDTNRRFQKDPARDILPS